MKYILEIEQPVQHCTLTTLYGVLVYDDQQDKGGGVIKKRRAEGGMGS